MTKHSVPPEKATDVEEIEVRLKPILGIYPTTYVPVVWGIGILLVLFFVGIYPGLRSYGSRLTVATIPQGAEVLVDGTRIGATPVTAFIDAGERVLTVSLPGHAPIERSITLKGRRLGSLFFPRKEYLHIRFDSFEIDGLLHDSVREFASWSTSGGGSAQFQYPPAANEVSRSVIAGMTASSALNGNDAAGEYLSDFIAYFGPHVSETQRTDFLGGASRIAAEGALFGPDAIARFIEEVILLESDSPGLHRVLPLFDDAISGHHWYTNRDATYSTELLATSVLLDEGARISPDILEIGPLRFTRVPRGVYIVGYPARDEESTGRSIRFEADYWIQDTEVSTALFDEFLATNQSWSISNRPALVESGLVRREYLSDASEIAGDARTFVSFYSVVAFVEWLNEDSPYPPIPGYRYGLPAADQWEYAAFLNDGAWRDEEGYSDDMGGLGIPIMSGGVWEWTDTWHAIHGRFLPAPVGDQRVVMGGSDINSDAGHSLRGAQPPDWTTPFLGFRIIMEPESDR